MSHLCNVPALPEPLPVLKKDGASLRLRPSPMRTNVVDSLIPSGANLLFGLRKACRDAGISYTTLRYAKVFVNGVPVPHEEWHSTLVCEGQFISVCIPLGKGGGKNPLASILQLVVVAVAAMATWYIGGTGAGWLGIKALGLGAGWGWAAGAAVMMGGMLLVNQIAGVSQPKLAAADNEAAAKVWSIDGAQNRADPYGVVPLVLGFIRFAPRFAAQYYTVLSGNEQYVRYLYVVGMGNVQVSDFRIGDTPIGNFQGIDYRVHQNWQGSGFAWFNRAVAEEPLSVLVKNSIGWTTRTTKAGTSHIALFFTFNGLKRIDNKGKSYPVSVELEVRYRRVGTSDWIPYGGTRTTGGGTINLLRKVSGNFSIGINPDGSLSINGGMAIVTGTFVEKREMVADEEHTRWYPLYTYSIENIQRVNGFTGSVSSSRGTVTIGNGSVFVPYLVFSGQTVTTQRRGVEFDVPEGQYEVSVRRVTSDSDKESTDQTIMDECTWTTLQSWSNRPAVIYQGRPLTLIEVQLKATEQLSGNVDEFNCYCQSIAPCWNGTSWTEQPTNNPASLALLVATSPCTGKSASWAEMDMDSYADFYGWCQRWGWAYNAVQTSRITAGELQHNIMGSGRGSYAMLNGHGVVWDDPDAPVMDTLSPRNTWGFSAKKEFLSEPVHGLRMRFLNETRDFQEDERVVYTDGYNETNATNVIEWEQDGVTSPDLIWKHGRLRLAELRLRPEVYTLNAEAESLTLRRGEHVRCQHDVTLWGIASGRIVARELNADGHLVSIELDEPCTIEFGKGYGIRVSTPTNPDVYYSVQTVPGVSRILMLAMPIPVTSSAPGIGDLVCFGVTGHTDQLLTVLSVTPSEGLTAQITLQDAAANIYGALTGEIPAWDSNITAPTRYQANTPPTPELTAIISDETVLTQLSDGTLLPRILVNWKIAETNVVIDSWYIMHRKQGDSEWITIPERNMGQTFSYISGVQEGAAYELAVVAISSLGAMSQQSPTVTHTVIGKTSPPPDIQNLSAVIDIPSGITLTWDEITVLDFSHYIVTGSFGGKTVDNRITLAAPNKTGLLPFAVVAVDTGGRKSKNPSEVSIEVKSPATPIIEGELRTDGLYVKWQDCKTTWPVHHYKILDIHNTTNEVVNSTAWLMSPRPEGDYTFQVIAVDIFQNESVAGYGLVHVGPIYPPQPAITIDNTDIVISWLTVESAFPIETYEIVFVDGTAIAKTKATLYRFPAPKAGTWEYRVRAIDVAGNISGWGEAAYVVTKPEPPQVTAALDGNGITVRWTATGHQLPIVAWDVVRQWDVARNDGVVETLEEDYGRLDADCLTVPAVSTGVHYFMARAVDSSGNISGWGDCDFTVIAPGKVTFMNCATVDNNVMLYWTEPDRVFFPIHEYVFSEIDEDGYEMEIGRIDAQFASSFETVSGEYIYGVTPVDVGGNRGAMSSIKMVVSQPPDFVFYHNKDSLFNGVKANFVLDGRGNMLGPVSADETWMENLERATLLSGSTVETWQDKIGADYTTWMEPASCGMSLKRYDGAVWARLCYQDVGEDGMTLFPDKEQAWTFQNADGTLFSQLWMLRDAGALFRQPDGKFEFLMFQSDATGPLTGDSSVYARWKQTDNPATAYYGNVGTTTDAVDGFEAIAKIGTSYPYGLALSSTASALLDGQPKHANWYGAVGLVSKYNTGSIPALTVQRYSQLWVRMPASVLAGGLGQYVETVDVGKLVPSTKITVTVSSRALSGNPAFACKIEVSQDNLIWRTIADNATVVYATQFRYVRYTITVSGGMAAISNINYALDVKRKTDFGRVEVKATDNGAGWTSETTTPLLTGKWVDFKAAFIDVESLPKPNVVNNQNLTAFTVFEDVENPKGFRIFVKDKNGNRADGTVDWAAYGV